MKGSKSSKNHFKKLLHGNEVLCGIVQFCIFKWNICSFSTNFFPTSSSQTLHRFGEPNLHFLPFLFQDSNLWVLVILSCKIPFGRVSNKRSWAFNSAVKETTNINSHCKKSPLQYFWYIYNIHRQLLQCLNNIFFRNAPKTRLLEHLQNYVWTPSLRMKTPFQTCNTITSRNIKDTYFSELWWAPGRNLSHIEQSPQQEIPHPYCFSLDDSTTHKTWKRKSV